MTKERPCQPPLVESDVESDCDCDSQPDLNAGFKAGENEIVDSDMRSEHPTQ
jgi:hypothetical protein